MGYSGLHGATQGYSWLNGLHGATQTYRKLYTWLHGRLHKAMHGYTTLHRITLDYIWLYQVTRSTCIQLYEANTGNYMRLLRLH